MASSNETIELAWQYFLNGEVQRAGKIVHDILVDNDNHPDALHLAGVIYYSRHEHQNAILMIEAAIKINKKFAPMYGNLALAKWALDDLKGAESSCRKALALNPAYADAHRVMGLVFQKQGKLKEAVTEFQRASKLGLNTDELRSLLENATKERHQ